jgi:uncharacterized surface protein with fasciclin (FAS1) repeats
MTNFGKLALAAIVAAPLSLAGPAAMSATTDIVQTAQSAGSFKTLIKAINAAGLADTLKGQGPFTVFAPTDTAFAALPAGKLDSLLKPENKAQLVQLLKHHVVPNKVTAKDIAGQMVSFQNLHGDSLKVDSAGRMTKVGEAALVTPDIMASNGVIHVIDQVIVPATIKFN